MKCKHSLEHLYLQREGKNIYACQTTDVQAGALTILQPWEAEVKVIPVSGMLYPLQGKRII